MLPNGINYFYVSDGDDFGAWDDSIFELNKINPVSCPSS
jgi:hypothetical protein